MKIETFLSVNPAFMAMTAATCFERDLNNSLAQIDMTFHQALSVAALYWELDQDVTILQLAKVLSISKARMSQIVSTLEAKHLLRREESRLDRRYCFLRLTKSGKEASLKVIELLNEWQERAESTLGEASVKQLTSALRQLTS